MTLALLFIVLVAAGVLLVLPRPVFTASAGRSVPVISHTVVRGDTLWDLAVRYGGEGDVRDAVKAIKETNHLKSAELQPGQVVLIPIAMR